MGGEWRKVFSCVSAWMRETFKAQIPMTTTFWKIKQLHSQCVIRTTPIFGLRSAWWPSPKCSTPDRTVDPMQTDYCPYFNLHFFLNWWLPLLRSFRSIYGQRRWMSSLSFDATDVNEVDPVSACSKQSWLLPTGRWVARGQRSLSIIFHPQQQQQLRRRLFFLAHEMGHAISDNLLHFLQ